MLLRSGGNKFKVIGTNRIRIYDQNYHFSPVDYILQALTHWGRELGIVLVKEMVPLMSQVGKDGVSDILLFTYKNDSSFRTITKNVFVVGNEILQEGAREIVKLLKFKNLLSIVFNSKSTLLARYSADKDRTFRIVVENRKVKLEQKDTYQKLINFANSFSSIIPSRYVINKLFNFQKSPPFSIKSSKETLMEYLYEIFLLNDFQGCEKLMLDSFGQGDFRENILVISGDRTRYVDNFALNLLSILTALNLKGTFSVYTDQYGLFDSLQMKNKKGSGFQKLMNFTFREWGRVLVIESMKDVKFDEISADIDVSEGAIERQIIPMYGRIVSFPFDGKGSINIRTRKDFAFEKKVNTLCIKDRVDHFIVDSRGRPVEYMSTKDMITSWLKGIEAIS